MEHEVILTDEDLEFLVDMLAALSLTLAPNTYQHIKARCLKGFFETILREDGKGEENETKLK